MYVIYGLYALGLLSFALPTIVGAIVAYVKRDDMRGTIYFDHVQFLLRTFWGSLIGLAVSALLIITFIGMILGVPLFFLVCLWYLFRVVAGIVRLIDNKPVSAESWLI
ncbi:hypothetical protein A7P95_01490 [Eikenella longinqua]|uniref:DUF4870 domain-containing protein n=2 Tax=Neisseriaceae TaxID=481 RepID=A0A1A9S3D9_9NEIS|nr:hypothetical protein A7P95_01490 [Eikenella longinqua]